MEIYHITVLEDTITKDFNHKEWHISFNNQQYQIFNELLLNKVIQLVRNLVGEDLNNCV